MRFVRCRVMAPYCLGWMHLRSKAGIELVINLAKWHNALNAAGQSVISPYRYMSGASKSGRPVHKIKHRALKNQFGSTALSVAHTSEGDEHVQYL